MRYVLKSSEWSSAQEANTLIPKQGCRELDLSSAGLHTKAAENYLSVLQAIPRCYDTLNLSGTLGRMAVQRVQALMAAIPAHITTLILSRNSLGSKTQDVLTQIFSSIPSTVRVVRLNQNELGDCPREVFAAIPDTVTHLDVSQNDLRSAAPAVIQTIITQRESVQLGSTEVTAGQLTALNAAMLANLTELDLRFNDLNRSLDPLISMLRAAPVLRMLGLVGNNLGACTPAAIQALMGAMPVTMQVLDLGSNHIWRWRAAGLIEVMAAIKPGIHTLILDNNDLQSMDYLVSVLGAVPAHISTLSLERNRLGGLSEDLVVALIAAIPPHVTAVRLRNTGLSEGRTLEQQAQFKQRLIAVNPACHYEFDSQFGHSDLKSLAVVLAGASPSRPSRQNLSRLELLPVEITAIIADYLRPTRAAMPNLYVLFHAIIMWTPEVDPLTRRITNIPGGSGAVGVAPVTQAIQSNKLDRPLSVPAPNQQQDASQAPLPPNVLLMAAERCTPVVAVLLLIAALGSAVLGMGTGLAVGLAIAGSVTLVGYTMANCGVFRAVAGSNEGNLQLGPMYGGV